MAKVAFNSLKLKTNSEVKTITIGDKTIEVKQYLPSEEKNSMLQIVIQQCDAGTVLNTFALDVLFHVYLVFEYTNLSFTDKQREDLFGLYDILDSNGIVDQVVAAIPETEYNILHNSMAEMVKEYITYRDSMRAVVEQFLNFIPKDIEAMKDTIKDVDVDKLGKILDIAQGSGYNN